MNTNLDLKRNLKLKNFLYSLIVFLVVVFSCELASGQSLNFGFEEPPSKYGMPIGWSWLGDPYTVDSDSVIRHSGHYSFSFSNTVHKPETYGGITHSINPYTGKTIELRAYIKLENVSDSMTLLIRTAGENNEYISFGGIGNKKGTSDWKHYTVKGVLSSNVKAISIVALLSGTGKVWVDDFEVLIDGENISSMEPVTEEVKMTRNSSEFDGNSGIRFKTMDSATVTDLTLLCKVWGFLKYYHPQVRKGNYNWDDELFRIMPEIISAESHGQTNKILAAWIRRLGQVEAGEEKLPTAEEIKLLPDLSWITPALGDDLYKQLTTVKYCRRSPECYYVTLFTGAGNPLFKNEDSWSMLIYPDAGYRLLALFRYWNMIQYYFPYRNLIDGDWESTLTEFIPELLMARNDFEYKTSMLRIIARVSDTHANMLSPENWVARYKGVSAIPAKIKFVQGMAVVTRTVENKAGEVPELKPGDIIKSVNGKKIESIISEKIPFTPASNYPTQLRIIGEELLRTNDTVASIVLVRDSVELNKRFKCISVNDFKPGNRKDSSFKILENNIAYLFPGSLSPGSIHKVMKYAVQERGLIIDLRCYPGDFIVYSLSEYLMPEKKEFVKFTSGSTIWPGLFFYHVHLTVGHANSNYFKGKIVIIVDEETQSQAEFTVMALRRSPRAIVIGSTTAGADGNVSMIYLPGGIRTMISGIGVYYPDGAETQRIGIVPDIEMKPTIKGIRSGKDELLERAIQIIKSE
jgi:C-terminal processing protease CtpA/Prc